VVTDVCGVLGIDPRMDADVSDETEDGVDRTKLNSLEPNTGGVKILSVHRDNIDVKAFLFDNPHVRLDTLIKLLKKAPPNASSSSPANGLIPGSLSKGSVIVYVWKKFETEIVAEQLTQADIEGGIVFYHGGMEDGKRTASQSKFMRGKVRICVATVAFGMGLNKSDIAGVIHMTLPNSPEHHLQEIGRAGRDGKPAQAIALVLAEEATIKHSLSYAHGITNNQISCLMRGLGGLVIDAVKEVRNGIPETVNDGKSRLDTAVDVALPLSTTIMAMDIPSEGIETLLTLLEEETVPSYYCATNATNDTVTYTNAQEQHSSPFLTFEGIIPDEGIITLKKRSLSKLVHDPVAKAIFECGSNLQHTSSQDDPESENHGGTAAAMGFHAYAFGSNKFSVIQCCRYLQWPPRRIYAGLFSLQDQGEMEVCFNTRDTSNNTNNWNSFKGRAMHIRVEPAGIRALLAWMDGNGDLGTEGGCLAIEKILERLYHRCVLHEKTGAKKVEQAWSLLHQVAIATQGQAAQTKSSRDTRESKDKIIDGNTHDDTTATGDGKSASLEMYQKLIHRYIEKRDNHKIHDSAAIYVESKTTGSAIELNCTITSQTTTNVPKRDSTSEKPCQHSNTAICTDDAHMVENEECNNDTKLFAIHPPKDVQNLLNSKVRSEIKSNIQSLLREHNLYAPPPQLLQQLSQHNNFQIPMTIFGNNNDDNCDNSNCVHKDYTALCLTKFLHSLESPRVPMKLWRHNFLWGKLRMYPFEDLLETIMDLI